MLKDFLEKEGYSPKSPRETIKLAFQNQIVQNGSDWLDALEKRNFLSHAYDEEKAQEALALIKDRYFTILSDLYQAFKNK